ncbi:threonine--tRNA ligase [Candidatus Marinimicrobia bacterium MT.SAG.3]|nr:threonine--tRNA ligase [Candidatus Marinimicrobia bacterium MT.SAG.3]
MKEEIKITLPDGTTIKHPKGVTGNEVASVIGAGLAKAALSIKVNGNLYDLSRPILEDAEIEILTDKSDESKTIIWHSTSHIMAQAVQELFPGTKVTLGPPIADGFYYDFDTEKPFTTDDLLKIETRMAEIISGDHEFTRETIQKDDAIKMFKEKGEEYKLEILSEIEDETVSIYTQNDWTDLCRGPHIPTTSKIKSFKLLKIAGSYWRGDEKRQQLQRIYGTSYSNEKELEQHLNRLKEAKLRDHRKIGKELELFAFHDIAPGSPFWLPNGMILIRELEKYLREKLDEAGYVEASTPMLVKKSLWEKSGHWDYYRDNMFVVDDGEEVYALKPMNCPESTYIYAAKTRSYRDLPIRIAEIGRLHRNEVSGALGGLFRVRQFTMDDAHLFLLPSQITEEVNGCMKLISDFYSIFGFEPKYYFATKPDKALGDPELWDKAEVALKAALDTQNIDYKLNEKDGAFYGPKIDIQVKDALGRSWQLATIQLDFVLPERFELNYIDENDKKQRPVMIHRAIFGSFERFIGVLIEHFTGNFPTWLAPVQVVVIPISEKHIKYATKVYESLIKTGVRVNLDSRSEKMGAKIRDSETMKIPYMLVVGEKEAENSSVSVRKHLTGDQGQKPLEEFIKEIKEEITERRLNNLN